MTRNQLLSIVAAAIAMTAGPLVLAQGAENATDAQITVRVKDRLAQKDPIIAPRIEVRTHAGVVTLKGVALTQQYILNAI